MKNILVVTLCRNTHERKVHTQTMNIPFQNLFILGLVQAFTWEIISNLYCRLVIPTFRHAPGAQAPAALATPVGIRNDFLISEISLNIPIEPCRKNILMGVGQGGVKPLLSMYILFFLTMLGFYRASYAF